jgi:amino acid transporter
MPSPAALKRTLGFRDLTLLYVLCTLSVRWTATAAAAGPSILVIWIAALAGFYVPLAACVMELSSRYPQEGGLYVWTRAAFGDFSGFMAAWTYWMSNLPYFPAVLYFGAGSMLFAFGARGHRLAASPAYYVGFSVAALLLMTVLNIAGANLGKWLINVASLASVVALLAVIVMGAVAGIRFGPAMHFAAADFIPRWSLKNAIFWSTVFFAFSGVEAASAMGDEIRSPRRAIPWAILASGCLLGFGYIAGTASLLFALPGHAVSGPDGFVSGIRALSTRLGLQSLIAPLAVLVGLNGVGAASAYLTSTSRLPFVAGLDRYLPAAFGRIHPRFGTPWVAIGVYGLAGIVMTMLGQAGTTVRGAYDVLVSMGILVYFLPYLQLFAAMICVQSMPAGPEVRRVPGGRPTAIALAAIGLASTAATIVLSLLPGGDEPHPWLATLKVVGGTAVLVGAGVLVFAGARKAADERGKAQGKSQAQMAGQGMEAIDQGGGPF